MMMNSKDPEHELPELSQPIIVICSTMQINSMAGQHRHTISSYSKASVLRLC